MMKLFTICSLCILLIHYSVSTFTDGMSAMFQFVAVFGTVLIFRAIADELKQVLYILEMVLKVDMELKVEIPHSVVLEA